MHQTFASPKGRHIAWLSATVFLAAVIAVLTLTPSVDLPAAPKFSDKTYHVAAFAALVFPTAFLRPRRLRLVAPLALCYGGLIEVIQPTVGRSASAMDFLADAVGVGLGLLLGLTFRRVFKKR